MSINKRWHRADLEISPLGMLVLLAVALLIVCIAVVAS